MIYIFYRTPQTVHLIRPLLLINRVETFKLAIFWKLPIFIDSTNKLTNFRRNRLRHQICPILRVFFNPKIEIAIFRFIETANFEKNYFNQYFNEIKKIFQFQKIKALEKKQNKIKNKQFLGYLPYGLQKIVTKKLLFFYFPNALQNELNCLLKLKMFH